MTPPAATVAGRRRTTGMRAGGSGSSRVGGRPAARRPARRVSGPARPAAPREAAPRPARARRAAPPRPAAARSDFADRPIAAFGSRVAAAAASAAAVALPERAPRRAPAPRPRAVPRPARRPDLPLGARALAWLRALPDHRLLHRLIGGRIWIVLIGTLLVGIVTMQLALLRLNAGIGTAVERTATLQQRNAELRLSISRLSDSERIVALGSQMGLVTPPQGSPRFLSAGPGDAGKALTTMRVPSDAPATVPTVTDATVTDAATTGAATAAPAATDPTTTTTTATTTATTDPAATTTTPAPAATVQPAAAQTPVTQAQTATPAPVVGAAAAPTGGEG